jgi:hypothetical protein
MQNSSLNRYTLLTRSNSLSCTKFQKQKPRTRSKKAAAAATNSTQHSAILPPQQIPVVAIITDNYHGKKSASTQKVVIHIHTKKS